MEARAEANAQKRARVQRFVGTARVANITLARIVEELRREPALLEDVRTRYAMGRSMRYLTEQVATSIEVPLIGGGTFTWVVASLPKLLKLLVEIRQAYLPNPFHNFRHGMMVAHKVRLVACSLQLVTCSL